MRAVWEGVRRQLGVVGADRRRFGVVIELIELICSTDLRWPGGCDKSEIVSLFISLRIISDLSLDERQP
jgi:hypothetical protein